MADLSDVETALVSAVSGALQETGFAFLAYRGAPAASALTVDLSNGVVHASVLSIAHGTREVTRWNTPAVATTGALALFASTTGTTTMFTGIASLGQLAGVMVDGATYVHRTIDGDSPALVAATLGSIIALDRPCQVSGASLSLPGAETVVGRTSADGVTLQELRRQTSEILVTLWTGTPAARDAAGSALDVALAGQAFLTLADGTAGRLTYRSSENDDSAEDAAVYRRNFVYCVEYGTVQQATAPSMLFGDLLCNGASIYA